MSDEVVVMAPVDPWNKAAECTQAIAATNNPHERTALGNLQSLWVELGNKVALFSNPQILQETQKLSHFQEEFLGRAE